MVEVGLVVALLIMAAIPSLYFLSSGGGTTFCKTGSGIGLRNFDPDVIDRVKWDPDDKVCMDSAGETDPCQGCQFGCGC